MSDDKVRLAEAESEFNTDGLGIDTQRWLLALAREYFLPRNDGLSEAKAIITDAYAPPAVEHDESCAWGSKQSCDCGRTQAAWYTHFMTTLDRLTRALDGS